jgi:hypothetical protein
VRVRGAERDRVRLGRFRYRRAGCSQVKPIPPCSRTHSCAACPATCEQYALDRATATAVRACRWPWPPRTLCGSIPIITAAIGLTSYLDAAKGTVAGTPDSRRSSLALAPLLSHDHGKAPASRHVVRKPDPCNRGRQAVKEPAHRDLSTLRPDALPSRPCIAPSYPKSQSGGSERVGAHQGSATERDGGLGRLGGGRASFAGRCDLARWQVSSGIYWRAARR